MVKLFKKGSLRKLVFVTILMGIVLLLSILPSIVNAPPPQFGEVCENGIAKWETNSAALNVTPCIVDSSREIGGHGYYVQYANLTWKGSPTNIDIAFKFDRLMRNSGLDLWQNVTRQIKNETEVNISQIDYGNGTLVNVSNFTISYYPKNFTEWVDKTSLVSEVQYGGNFYYLLTNIPSATSQLFQARLRFAKQDVGFGGSLKWGLFGKLSSDSIAVAISTGRYSELDPLVNATAANVTAAADIDLQNSTIQFMDGKFVGAAITAPAGKGRPNFTAFDYFSDNEITANPNWDGLNQSTNGAGCGTGTRVRADQGFLNITSDTNGVGCHASAVMDKNITVPDPEGLVASFFLNIPQSNVRASVCFIPQWNQLVSYAGGSAADGKGCDATASAGAPDSVGVGYSTAGENEWVIRSEDDGTDTSANMGSTIIGTPQNVTWWFNSSHHRVSINTSTGTLDSGLKTISSDTIKSGGKFLFSVGGFAVPTDNAWIDNFFVANATQFGAPPNFTRGNLKTSVLNTTAVVTSFKVTNQTLNYADSAAIFNVFDASNANLQNVTEGSFNTITEITGNGMNVTLTPVTNYSATEFTSFLVEWNPPAASDSFPTLLQNFSNISTFRKGNVVQFGFNLSESSGLFVQHNNTADGLDTNITVGNSGINNASVNLTMLFGNQTNFCVKPYFNDSANQMNNTVPKACHTTSNTAPFGIPRINIPPNQSVFNVSSVTFNATNISDLDNNTVTLYWHVNDLFNASGAAVDGNQRGNVTIAGLNSGNYTIRVQSYDGTAFSSNSTTTNFTVDTIAPAISFIANTPATNSFNNINSLFINTSENDAGSDHNELSAFIDFNNSLVGYWRFEDDADTNASDSSGYNNNGTLVGFGCTAADCNLTGGDGGVASGFTSAGKRGKAMAFDSVNDRINVSDSNSLDITGALTVAAWIKPGTVSPGFQGIVRKGPIATTGENYGIWLAGDEFNFEFRCGSAWCSNTTVNRNLIAGQWYHVAATYSDAADIVSLYVNGVNQSFIQLNSLATDAGNLIIGHGTGGGEQFNGTIDEVKIWNRALTAEEINASFQAGTYRLFRNFTGLSDGNYSYQAHVVDLAGNINSTASRNATIDTTFPTVNFSIGSDANNSFLPVPRIKINISSIETNPNRLNITLRNGTNLAASFNISYNTTPLWNNFNFTSLADDKYNISVVLTDLASNRNSSPSNLTITVDTTNPSVTNTLFATTGGITTSPLLLGQTLDWIAATATDTFINHVNITLTDGSGGTVVNNQLMTNQGSNVWNYTTNVLLNGAGNWTVTISAYDNASNVGTNLTNITVNTQNISTQEGLYGYSNDSLFSVGDITALNSYGYDVYEISDNFSTLSSNWGTVLAAINASKSASALIGLNYKMDFNVSISNDVNKSNTNITLYFPDLKKSPYTSVVSYISFEVVNKTQYNDTDKTAALNSLATTAANAFVNQFPVYSKNFNNSNLTSAVIKFTPLLYVYAGSQVELITNEQTLMRGNKSLNRIYVNLTAVLKTQAKSFQNNVIDQLRGTPSFGNKLGNSSVAEIDGSVNDAVVFNVGASEILVNINISNITGTAGKDVWDATQKKLLENNTDGSFDINISAYSANLLFTEDIDHIQLTSLSSGKVFKASAASVLNLNYTDGTRDDNYALYGANDARIELFDPTYVGNNFLTYYGWINASTVNLSNKLPYTTGIISDKLNQEIDKLNYSTSWYAYISVADYANTNAWVTSKETEVDDWIALNGSLNIFIDGLDTGIGGTNFSSRFRDVVDYTRITKAKKVILNTYTVYENFSTMGDGVMKESCIQRWNGADPAAPTSYTREEWTLELNRSKFFKNHNIPVYCQAFGNRTSFNQIENYTDALNLYYAAKVLGYQNWYESQPDFNYVHTIYVPNLGTDLAKDASTDDNVTYYRRYANGIVYYNTSSTQGWLSDGRKIASTKLCFDLYDAHANGVTFSFTINNEVTGATAGDYNFSDSELAGVGVWATKCVTLNASHQNLGRWDIQSFVTPRTTIVGQGLNIGNAIVSYENRHSWYDSSTSPNVWTQYGMGQNWQINIEINDTKKASIDTVNTITQTDANATISGKLLQNITLSSGFNVSAEVWSNPTFVNSTKFLNLTYLSGTSFVLLYPQNNTDCDTDNPTLNSTIVGGNTLKSCIMPSSTGYKIRVAPNKLSDQVFQANFQSNTAPTAPTIIFPTEGIATPLNRINYSSTDAEGDAITYYVSFNETFNYSATTNTTFNASPEKTYAVNVSAYDGTDFSSNTSVQFVYDNLAPRLNNGSNSDNTTKFVNRNWAFLNFTFTEPFNATAFILNTSGSTTNNATPTISGTYFYANFTNLSDGSYQFRGWMNDSATNVNQTAQINITVDTIAPNVTILTPEENSEVSSDITITYLVNDTSGVSSCNTVSEVLGTINNGTALNISNSNNNNLLNSTGLAEGNQVAFQMRCTDLAGNAAASQARTFKITTTLPPSSGDTGSTITYEKINKEGCGSEKTAYEFGGATYCTSCNGVMTEAGGKVYCVEPTEATISQNIADVASKAGVPIGAIAALAAFAAVYVLFFTNLIIKWKKGGKGG